MSIGNNQNLQIVNLQNQYVPERGIKAIPVQLDFTNDSVIDFDFSPTIDQGKFDMIQTIYIDASNLSAGLVVVCNGSNQTLPIKPFTAGYYTILCPNPAKLRFVSTQGAGQVALFLLNVPISGTVWPTV